MSPISAFVQNSFTKFLLQTFAFLLDSFFRRSPSRSWGWVGRSSHIIGVTRITAIWRNFSPTWRFWSRFSVFWKWQSCRGLRSWWQTICFVWIQNYSFFYTARLRSFFGSGSCKGQLISECLFDFLNFQETNEKIWWISGLES